MAKPKRDPYNDGYTHEVLHTAHVLADTWDNHVIATRCAEQFSDVKAAAEKVGVAMYEFYQLVGTKFADEQLKTDNEKVERAAKAIHDAMDVTDGLDTTVALKYAKAALAALTDAVSQGEK